MKLRINEWILYRVSKQDKFFWNMIWLMENYDNETEYQEDFITRFYECFHQLVELASQYGWEGNLWHQYLTFLLANHENAFSKACEIGGSLKGSLKDIALHDFSIFLELYQYDFQKMCKIRKVNGIPLILDYQAGDCGNASHLAERLLILNGKLSNGKDADEMLQAVVSFYKDYGVGKLGLHKAFRVQRIDQKVEIVPIINTQQIRLSDLVGYEIQKKKLMDNTEAFVSGRKANNCLLFGDAGTGKSSSIKAILNEYYDRGLRMIEIYKHQFKDLSDVIAQMKDRNYKFIIYMDDLSFEEFEIEYKYLKAVIEGGLEERPDNVLIYATSNRRHLVREKFSDKEERRDDLHASDTVQEKLSLAARFGVSIFFVAPDKKEYQNIISVLANRHGIFMPEEELYLEANKWELSHGGLSGRTAQQFIDYLLGIHGMESEG